MSPLRAALAGTVLLLVVVSGLATGRTPLLLAQATSTPSVVSERWGANSTAEHAGNPLDVTLNGLYPDWAGNDGGELIIRSGGGYDAWALLHFDVSNLPPATVVRSARLRLSLYSHVTPLDAWEPVHQLLDPDGLGSWSESGSTFNRRRTGVPWSNTAPGNLTTAIGPELSRFYLGNLAQWRSAWAEWDVTPAVRAWVADPATNQGLLLPHIEGGLYTAPSSEGSDAGLRPYLEITYEGPNPSRPAQVTGVQVLHRSGQTFITWNEINSGNSEERYRVYRYTAPITAANTSTGLSASLDDATLLAEVQPGSGYYAHEVEGCSNGSGCSPIGQTRFIIEDDGAPLPDGVGLFVYTMSDSGQLSVGDDGCSLTTEHCSLITDHYYAVTSVVEGNENRQDFGSNTAGPVAESQATPRPVRIWSNATDTGWVYTRFMDYHRWNSAVEGYAYNFYIGVPAGYDPNGPPLPLLMQLHAYTGTYRLPSSPGSGGTDYQWPVIQVFPDDRTNTWWFGFGQNAGTGQPLYATPIVDYTHQRLDAILDFVQSEFYVDQDRLYLWGGSMGGSGTVNYGLRRGNVFAAIYAESAMTDFAAAGDAGGTAWEDGSITRLWGTVAQNLPIQLQTSLTGESIWEWYDLQSWAQANPGAELPFLADHHGRSDDVIDYETQGAPWYPALETGRHGFVGVFDNADHSWPGFVANSDVFTLTDFNFRRDESFPALSNATNSDDPATTTGCRNCRLEWSSSWNDFAGPPVDTAGRYELVLRTTDGGTATADVTPRRVQYFAVTPGASYVWENRRVSDNGLVASGSVVADAYGLVTVAGFQVMASGNQLILEPAGGIPSTATPTPTVTPTHSPTSTPTPTPTDTLLACSADVTGDGVVDVEDMQAVAAWWRRAGFPPEADVNKDDGVDINDLMAVIAQWGQPCGGSQPTATPTATPTPTNTPTSTQEPGTLDVPLTVTDNAGVAGVGDPVTSGVPLPRAANVTDVGQLQLTDAAGQPVPAQFTPLARWGGAPDDATKPLKWVLVDFQADVVAGGSATYRLRTKLGATQGNSGELTLRVRSNDFSRSGGDERLKSLLRTEGTGSTIEVDTGVARFVISDTGFTLFEQVYLDRDGDGAVDDALLAGPGEIVAITSDGTVYRADTSAPGEVAVELAGPLHTVVRVRGHLRSATGDPSTGSGLAYTARLHFYAGHPAARVMFSVWNDNPMVNDGTGQPAIKAFGSPNTVLFDDLSLSLQLAGTGSPTYVLAGGPGETWTGTLTDAAELYQDSSGGPQWNHAPDNTANTFRGFQASANGATLHPVCGDADNEDTCRSEGWAGLLAPDGGIAAGVRHFWQSYPKAVALSADGTVSVGLFPGRYSQDFELRVGEQKTHEVLFFFGAEDVAGHMTALLDPLHAWASSEYYLEEAGAFDRAVPHNAAAFPDFEGYVDAAILDDAMNLLWLRDGGVGSGWYYAPRPEAWGWRNFGDTIAEDETSADWYPIFTNQQYDHPWVAILQMVRSLGAGGGRPGLWWQVAESGARHQADVDIIHSLCTGWSPAAMVACMDTEQGPPYATGWAMGGRLTNQHHAEYSPNVHRHALIDYWSGGIRGMLYYYFLTGDGAVQDAWLEMAENARWRVDNSPCDPSCGPGYSQLNPGEGDGRSAAYALEILTDAYAATGDPAYLASAQRVVARSHPDNTWFGQAGFTLDPNVSPSGRQTSPWSLGMIMKSLGRYLDVTVEWTGAPDATARDSLLRYAELMAGWWRLGEAEPTCYYFGENGGCTPQAQNYFLADGLAWALAYDDGRADRARWEGVAADAWQKSENEPWGPGYAKDTFLTAKTHMMHANNGVAWMRYALGRASP